MVEEHRKYWRKYCRKRVHLHTVPSLIGNGLFTSINQWLVHKISILMALIKPLAEIFSTLGMQSTSSKLSNIFLKRLDRRNKGLGQENSLTLWVFHLCSAWKTMFQHTQKALRKTWCCTGVWKFHGQIFQCWEARIQWDTCLASCHDLLAWWKDRCQNLQATLQRNGSFHVN